MLKNEIVFTVSQFAKLHHLNKRTLHYYDDIGLFSPAFKGENDYRYYTYAQSAKLEHILSLREMNLSIDEIRAYLEQPAPQKFLSLTDKKLKEIDEEIMRLKKMKLIWERKRDLLRLSTEAVDGQIDLVRCEEEYLLITPLEGESSAEDGQQIEVLLNHLQAAWEMSRYKAGCGSMIAVGKVKAGRFECYDGLFTEIEKPEVEAEAEITRRAAGVYLRGFCVGSWDRLPALYGKMAAYAKREGLELFGYAYETGLNEVAISGMEKYVTQILIPCTAETGGNRAK